MRDLAANPKLFSINNATLGFQIPLEKVIDEVARAGFGGLSPWRREVEGYSVDAIARRIRDAGLKVPSYCRSTYIPAADRQQFLANVADNKAAIDDAAILGASCFMMVVGSLPEGSKDISAARAQVKEASAMLAEHGQKSGVKIALEPLHPVYAADRSCLTTLGEALDWCDDINHPSLGVCIDAYHVWWDPNLAREIARAGSRILAFHVCDWLVPTRDVLLDRGMMGDGVIDLPALRGMVEAAGYEGLVEVEIFSSENWWKRSAEETLGVIKSRLGAI
ncbi:MAG: sugar phosphate isomerase/epimerase family protein [Aestuariivirga sp.]